MYLTTMNRSSNSERLDDDKGVFLVVVTIMIVNIFSNRRRSLQSFTKSCKKSETFH